MKIKKHLWKFGLGAIAVAIPSIALTSCGSGTSPSKTFAELVVSDDTSTLLDKSFSETTYNGWRNFMIADSVTNQHGIPDNYTKETLDMPEVNSGSKDLDLAKGYWRRPGGSRENTFRQIFNGGPNLILAPGFNHQQAVQTVANQMKNKGFILLDASVDTTLGDFTNVASFTFRAEQSGFLAGIATAEFLNANKEIFKNTSLGDDGKLKVGGFVGKAFPSTMDFLAGFQHGIIAYNLSTTSTTSRTSVSKEQIEWVSLGGDLGSYESGSFASGEGDAKSKDLINTKGVDAIIPIAGPQTRDAISVVQQSKRPVIVIGVDSEQEKNSELKQTLTNEQLGGKKLKGSDDKEMNTAQILQFSAIKKLDEAVYQTLVAIFNEADPNNANYNSAATPSSNDSTADTTKAPVQGFGYNNIGTLDNRTVGISEAGLGWIKKFNNSWVTDEGGDTFNSEGGIYDNVAYKELESKGILYTDISNLTSANGAISGLDSKGQVTSALFSDGTNRVFSELKNNNPPASLNKKEGSTSLNGSVWSLKKGELKQKPESTEPKKYTI